MGPKDDSLRDRLLMQHVPQVNRLEDYRKEIQTMLERHEKMLRRQNWYAKTLWIYAVLLSTLFLLGMAYFMPGSPWIGFSACLLLISAAVELLKYCINHARVEVLKEVKGIEMQLLELRESLRTRSNP